jgi:hypothetical protein
MVSQGLVTLDHIRAAAAALQAEGRNVSSRAVREKLGNVGSMGTINKLLQEYAENKADRLAACANCHLICNMQSWISSVTKRVQAVSRLPMSLSNAGEK